MNLKRGFFMQKYLTTHGIKKKKSNDNKDLIVLNTDFELMEVIFNSSKIFSSVDSVIRFISDDIDEYYALDKNNAIFYLPDHIVGDILNAIENFEENSLSCVAIDPLINQYLPEELQVDSNKLTESEWDFQTRPNKEKGDIGTSFFRSCNSSDLDDIKNIANQLRENIADVSDDLLLFGSIPKDYGIIEQSKILKTKEPQSRHCHFWKLKESITGHTFWSIGSHFELIN